MFYEPSNVIFLQRLESVKYRKNLYKSHYLIKKGWEEIFTTQVISYLLTAETQMEEKAFSGLLRP